MVKSFQSVGIAALKKVLSVQELCDSVIVIGHLTFRTADVVFSHSSAVASELSGLALTTSAVEVPALDGLRIAGALV